MLPHGFPFCTTYYLIPILVSFTSCFTFLQHLLCYTFLFPLLVACLLSFLPSLTSCFPFFTGCYPPVFLLFLSLASFHHCFLSFIYVLFASYLLSFIYNLLPVASLYPSVASCMLFCISITCSLSLSPIPCFLSPLYFIDCLLSACFPLSITSVLYFYPLLAALHPLFPLLCFLFASLYPSFASYLLSFISTNCFLSASISSCLILLVHFKTSLCV